MSDLRDTIKLIQGEAGVERDGVFGPVTAAAVLRALRGDETPKPTGVLADLAGIDARSQKVLLDLDAKAVPLFARFLRLAKATAATLGCDYVLISGHRTWEEQNALYAQGRTKPGKIVTKARGGYSNHNFKIAADAGVFRAGGYLDETQPTTAAKIHEACSQHARDCGLAWGGSWNGLKDLPHYEVLTGLSMAAKRKVFKEEGSVL